MPNRRFTCARLSHSYLTRSMPRLLTMTFTTAVFSRSSSWRFEAFPCRTAPKGPPSSLVQHDAFSVFLTQYLYGYLNRVQSSRRLEREAQRNIELMWLTGRLAPDFKTIADFRKD